MHARPIASLLLALPLALGPAAPANASEPDSNMTADRAALEELLRERTVVPTGQVRRFDLDIREADWELLPGVSTRAVTFNGTVPGTDDPGDGGRRRGDRGHQRAGRGRPPSTGTGSTSPMTRMVSPGSRRRPSSRATTFTYRFMAPHAGTFMYHAHGDRSREQIDRGLYAPFIIDPAGGDPVGRGPGGPTLALQWWMVGEACRGWTGWPPHPMSMEYDYFTINGKAFPATVATEVTAGRTRAAAVHQPEPDDPSDASPRHGHGRRSPRTASRSTDPSDSTPLDHRPGRDLRCRVRRRQPRHLAPSLPRPPSRVQRGRGARWADRHRSSSRRPVQSRHRSTARQPPARHRPRSRRIPWHPA